MLAVVRGEALGLLEVKGWTPSMAALDAAEKAGDVRVLQVELNDLYGACVKLVGPVSDVQAALAAGRTTAEAMRADVVTDLIPGPAPESRPAYESKPEFSPLIEQDVVHLPVGAGPRARPGDVAKDEGGRGGPPLPQDSERRPVSEQAPFAIGMIETQGLTAVIEAVDTAVKAANVEVLGKEKLGGGYVTVILKGDVAAVNAAVSAGRERVEGLGKLIATHVIPRPSAAVLSLLPKV